MANWTKYTKKGMGKSTSAYGSNKKIKKTWAKAMRADAKKVLNTAKKEL